MAAPIEDRRLWVVLVWQGRWNFARIDGNEPELYRSQDEAIYAMRRHAADHDPGNLFRVVPLALTAAVEYVSGE